MFLTNTRLTTVPFSSGPSSLNAWSNNLNKPPLTSGAAGLWNVPSDQNANQNRSISFRNPTPPQATPTSSIFSLGMNSSGVSNFSLFNNSNPELVRPESPGTPTFGPQKDTSKGLMSTQQGSSNFSLFNNPSTPKTVTSNSLWTNPTSFNTAIPKNNTVNQSQSSIFTRFNAQSEPFKSSQPAQTPLFSNILQAPKQNNNQSSKSVFSNNIPFTNWNNQPKNAQQTQPVSSSIFAQNNLGVNKNNLLNTICNIQTKNPQAPQTSQTQTAPKFPLFTPPTAVSPQNIQGSSIFKSQPGSFSQNFKPSTSNHNQKNGLPFSWSKTSHESKLFKPKQQQSQSVNQATFQWPVSPASVQPSNNTLNSNLNIKPVLSVGEQSLVDNYASNSYNGVNAGFVFGNEAYGPSQSIEFPYNPFEDSDMRRNQHKSYESTSKYHTLHKKEREFLEREGIEYEYPKSTKELKALKHSRDLVRELTGQDNRMNAAKMNSLDNKAKESQKDSDNITVYVMFLEGEESERTIAVDVSGTTTALELKQTVLKLIFGDNTINHNAFKIHRNGELFEETKSFKDLNVQNLEYLILEKTEANSQ